MRCPARYPVEERAAALVKRQGIRGGIFIGDGLDDLRAAERIGSRFLLAGWGYGTSCELADRPDITVIRQPADMLAAIEAVRSAK